jgi:hypothetical protein
MLALKPTICWLARGKKPPGPAVPAGRKAADGVDVKAKAAGGTCAVPLPF